VSCMMCLSENQRNLGGEMGVRFPGLKSVDKPVVWCFQSLWSVLIVGSRNFRFLKANCDG